MGFREREGELKMTFPFYGKGNGNLKIGFPFFGKGKEMEFSNGKMIWPISNGATMLEWPTLVKGHPPSIISAASRAD